MKPMGCCHPTVAAIAMEANLAGIKEICRISILQNKLFSNVPALRLQHLVFAANAYLGSTNKTTKIVLRP